MPDNAVVISIVSVGIAGLTGIAAAFVGKKAVSKTDLQTAVSNQIKDYMTLTDASIKRIKQDHDECETRIRGLKGVVMKLVKALRERGIPMPAFELHEQLMLEDKSFHESNGVKEPTRFVRPE